MPNRRVSKNISHRTKLKRQHIIESTVKQLSGPEVHIIYTHGAVGIDLPLTAEPGTEMVFKVSKATRIYVPPGWQVIFQSDDTVKYRYR